MPETKHIPNPWDDLTQEQWNLDGYQPLNYNQTQTNFQVHSFQPFQYNYQRIVKIKMHKKRMDITQLTLLKKSRRKRVWVPVIKSRFFLVIDSLTVHPSWRRQGKATELLQHLQRLQNDPIILTNVCTSQGQAFGDFLVQKYRWKKIPSTYGFHYFKK